jgi:hypothetical protein
MPPKAVLAIEAAAKVQEAREEQRAAEEQQSPSPNTMGLSGRKVLPAVEQLMMVIGG